MSSPRIGNNTKRYGTNTSMDCVGVVLVPCAVSVACDDKVGSLVRIAEHIPDESFVDTHSVMEKDDSRLWSKPGDQGLDGINHSVGLECHDERLDWEGCVLNDALFVFSGLETGDPRVFGFGGFASVQLGL